MTGYVQHAFPAGTWTVFYVGPTDPFVFGPVSSWDFGDGSPASDSGAHAFAEAGVYTVTVTVSSTAAYGIDAPFDSSIDVQIERHEARQAREGQPGQPETQLDPDIYITHDGRLVEASATSQAKYAGVKVDDGTRKAQACSGRGHP